MLSQRVGQERLRTTGVGNKQSQKYEGDSTEKIAKHKQRRKSRGAEDRVVADQA